MHTEQKPRDNKNAQTPANNGERKPAYHKKNSHGQRSFKKGFKKTPNNSGRKPKKKLTPSKARGSRCYLRCKEIWGDLFDLKNIKPFSMHIRNELIEDAAKRGIEISSSVIYTGLHWVVNTYLYQKTLSNGGFRFDMHGNKATEITEDQIKLALENCQKIKEARKANRKKAPVRNGKRPFKKRPQSGSQRPYHQRQANGQRSQSNNHRSQGNGQRTQSNGTFQKRSTESTTSEK